MGVTDTHASRPAETIHRQVVSLELDGARTPILVHRSDRPTGAPIVMLHGIQSHPGWFVGSADALARAGHTVVQFTRRGSGTNRIGRGHAKNPEQLLGDLDRVIAWAADETGAERVGIVGISWGGKWAACYGLDSDRSKRAAGLTLVAPGIIPRVDVSAVTKLAVAACLAVWPRRTFEIPLSDPALFTDTLARREYIADDPHRLHRATARFLATSRRMDWMLQRADDGAIDLPITLITAETDRIIDSDATETVIRRLAGDGFHALRLPGTHTLEFEPNPTPLYDALVRAAQWWQE